MDAFLLLVDADAETGDFVGKVGKLMALGEIALNRGIKQLTIDS